MELENGDINIETCLESTLVEKPPRLKYIQKPYFMTKIFKDDYFEESIFVYDTYKNGILDFDTLSKRSHYDLITEWIQKEYTDFKEFFKKGGIVQNRREPLTIFLIKSYYKLSEMNFSFREKYEKESIFILNFRDDRKLIYEAVYVIALSLYFKGITLRVIKDDKEYYINMCNIIKTDNDFGTWLKKLDLRARKELLYLYTSGYSIIQLRFKHMQHYDFVDKIIRFLGKKLINLNKHK